MPFQSNLDEVLAALKMSKEQALEDVGLTCVAETQLICPVDTGNLRRSITSQVEPEESAVEVGATHAADYAPYVNNGTSKQPAQHFLDNGVRNGMQNSLERIKAAYSRLGGA